MRRYIILIFVAFVVFAVIMLPAQIFKLWFNFDGLKLSEMQGTVWTGSGSIDVEQGNIGRLQWNIRLHRLFFGELSYQVFMQNPSITIDGKLSYSFSAASFVGNGRIKASLINRVMETFDTYIEGEFELSEVSVAVNHSQEFRTVEGSVFWGGGKVRTLANSKSKSVQIPPLAATLMNSDDEIVLESETQNNNTDVLKLRLEPATGWVHIALSRHILELAEMPWATSGDENEYVLEISRQIYQRAH